jgi:hypothetical protein
MKIQILGMALHLEGQHVIYSYMQYHVTLNTQHHENT